MSIKSKICKNYKYGGVSLCAGDECNITFDQNKLGEWVINVQSGNQKVEILCDQAYQYFSEFLPPPDVEELMEQYENGECESVTGEWVEPDGFGPDGSPSWLMVYKIV